MKRLVRAMLIVGLAGLLAACASPNPAPGKMIEPGDQLGDFLVTKGEAGDVTYTWQLDCAQQGSAEEYACQSVAGEKVNVSTGVFAAFSGKDLDTVWSEHTYELYINDRPVNLQAFGSIDVTHPRAGQMRHWNVVIVAAKPGKITIRDSGVVNGQSAKSKMTYTFNAP